MLFHFPHLVAVLKSSESESRDYKQEYADFHGKPSQIKARAERNAARRKLGLKRGDGKEADHKNPISNGGSNSTRNLRAVSRSTNRKKGASVKKDGDWAEDKHPRADNGQFGSGSGGSSPAPKPKPSKTKRKLDRRAEAARGTTGAIQTLLGGGSALDKIGWLKTSPKPDEAAKPDKTPTSKPESKPAEPPKPQAHPAPKKPLTTSFESLRDIGEAEPERAEGDVTSEGDPAQLDPGRQKEQYETNIERLKWRVAGGDISQHEADVLRRDLERSRPQARPEGKPAKKPGKKPVPYGINPKHDPMNVLDFVESKAKYGDIGETRVQQLHIMNAVQGIKYALATGRLHGYADITMRHLKGGDMARLVEEISTKELSQADIPRYLNERYTADKPAQDKPKEPEQAKPKQKKPSGPIDLTPVQEKSIAREIKSRFKGQSKDVIRRFVAATDRQIQNIKPGWISEKPENLANYHRMVIEYNTARHLI